MEFLVHIRIELPESMLPADRERLRDAEGRRAQELRRSGALKRIWRDPGRAANWSLYEVPHATELHEVLSSLPLWPWMRIRVHPLAVHPAESSSD